jgi:DDE superfamily endonuclease
MEDVLELYAEADDADRPVVCFDECSKELHGQVAEPIPVAPGRPAKEDYEYVRHGTANLFPIVEPLAGRRQVTVTERRTIPDFAAQMRYLCDELYPGAAVIRVVLDNLNTHTLGSLFASFPPDEAWRLARRLEFHYTPKHASWLNMAECELSVLASQCLGRRIPTREQLATEVAAWVARRNAEKATIEWTFRVADARVKLGFLYPKEFPR